MGTFHKPIECKIGNLFLNYSIMIPAFQRPYSWTLDQIEDLWLDIKECVKTQHYHYIGPMYFTVSGLDPLEVTDGQQRITSFQLFFLAMLRVIENRVSTFEDQEVIKRYENLHSKLIMLNRKEDKLILELGSSDKDAYLKINENYKNLPLEVSEWRKEFDDSLVFLKSAENLHRNFIYLSNKLDNLINESLPNLTEIDDITEELKEKIRNHYLSSLEVFEELLDAVVNRFVFIQLIILEKSDLKSFKLFETINDRGKPLDQVDKIKNYLFKNIYRMVIFYPDESIFQTSYEDIKSKWSSLQKLLDNDLEDYIRYYLNQDSKIDKYIRQKELFEKIVFFIENNEILKETATKEEVKKYYLNLFDKSMKLVDELDKNKGNYFSIIEPGKANDITEITKANLKFAYNYGIIRSVLLKIIGKFRNEPKKLEKLVIVTTNAAILYVSVYNLKKLESVERVLSEHFGKRFDFDTFFLNYGTELEDKIHEVNPEFSLDTDILKRSIINCSNDKVNNYILIKLNDYLNHKKSSDFYYTHMFINKDGLSKDHILPTNFDAEYRMKIVDHFVQKDIPIQKSKHLAELYLNRIGNIMPLKIDPNRVKTNRNDPLVFYRDEMTVKGELVQDLLKYAGDEWLLDDIQRRSERIADQIISKGVLELDYTKVLY